MCFLDENYRQYPSTHAASCVCSVSGPCLSTNADELVLTASQHNTNASHIIDLESFFRYTPSALSKLVTWGFGHTPLTLYKLLASISFVRKGFQCRFRVDHSWEPRVTKNWTDPFAENRAFFVDPTHFFVKGFLSFFGTITPVVQPEEVEMKLAPHMLTTTGFTALNFGGDEPQEPQLELDKSIARKYYVGVSGGGWRALTGHMGAFRALSDKGVLPTVDMVSSVSGGTWFLTKLAFDERFSEKVLRNDTQISHAVLQWMERDYFPAIQNAIRLRQNDRAKNDKIAAFISILVSKAPKAIRSVLSSGILAANHFNFSWQQLVEQAVLGQSIAYRRPLAKATLTREARNSFGQATLAFNWNQLHQWESTDNSTCSKWFLRQAHGDNHVQYPVYTSALYQQSTNGNISVDVIMQGKAMENLFDVCFIHGDAFCGDSNKTIHPKRNTIVDTLWSWLGDSTHANPIDGKSECGDFQFQNLTVGQVASASSAAVGGGAVRAWVQSVIELVRRKAKDALKGSVNVLYCSQYRMLIENLLGPCNRNLVIEEFFKFLGCEHHDEGLQVLKEDSAITAKRWAFFLRKMAVKLAVSSPLSTGHTAHMAIDAV